MSKTKFSPFIGWWIVGLIILMIGGLSMLKASSHRDQTNLSNRELSLSCTTDMATQFHIHPHLDIIINGQSQTIPANIGIDSGCMHPLHTHDDTGKIHVEAPGKRDFTLADWFTVWGKTFNREQILDAKVDATHVIRVRVNGQDVNTYENTILHDKDQIVISYEENK